MHKLRIFYASDNTPNDSLNSNIWRLNLLYSLIDLGYDVIEFDYDLRKVFTNLDSTDPVQRRFIEKNRPRSSQALLNQILKEHEIKPIDYFFSYFYDACILPETIDLIKAKGIKTINWFCNGSYQLNLVSEISPHYDYCLVPEQFRVEDYRAIGANPIYFQEAANPNIYKPYSLNYEFDVSFVGQNYGNRSEYIRYLVDSGVDVRVWGTGWRPEVHDLNALKTSWMKFLSRIKYGYSLPKAIERAANLLASKGDYSLPKEICGNPLSDQKLIKMYSRSKINLGFSVVGNTHKTDNPIRQVRLRDFEIPMCGGFYLMEYLPEIETFYEIGKEIVCFSTKEELVEKVQYYLKHPDEREKIRWAGYARAQRDHSWQKRFADLFIKLGLDKKNE